MYRKVEKDQGKDIPRWNHNTERMGSRKPFNDGRRREYNCHECGGKGHFIADCPTAKRKDLKCSECSGYGHTDEECPSKNKTRLKSFIGKDDSETEEEEDEMINMVAFAADEDPSTSYDSDDEDREIDPSEEYDTLYESWLKAHNENKYLINAREKLNAQLECLKSNLAQKLQKTDKVKKEILATQLKLTEERHNSASFQEKLDNMNLEVKLLNQGTSKLDQILSMGILNNRQRGLGYNYSVSSTSQRGTQPVKFVAKGSTQSDLKIEKRVTNSTRYQVPPQRSRSFQNQHRVCEFCNKFGHYRRKCLGFKRQIQKIWKSNKYYPEPRKVGYVWIAKDDLYNKKRSINTQIPTSDKELKAFSAQSNQQVSKWYFDSGCSKHMTGKKSLLQNYSNTQGGNISFGGGVKGKIRGIGSLNKIDQPCLTSVLLVEGLKANLISVSQLCDNDQKVLFTKEGCIVMNNKEEVILRGSRSSNNCYIWDSSLH